MFDAILGTLKAGFGTVLSLLFAIIGARILARGIGPSGMGIYSLVKQLSQASILIGCLNAQQLLVQGFSSRSEHERPEFEASTVVTVLLSSLLLALILIVGAPALAKGLANTSDPAVVSLMRWCGPAVIAGCATAYCIAVVNSKRAIGQLAISQALAALSAAGTAPLAVWFYRHNQPAGLNLLLIASGVTNFTYLAVLIKRKHWFRHTAGKIIKLFQVAEARRFISLGAVSLLAAVLQNFASLGIRAGIVRQFGLGAAGYFEVAWTFSMAYVMLLLSSFATYYLPELAAAQETERRVHVMQNVFRVALFGMVPLVTTMVVCKPLLVRLLYSSSFLPSLDILRWMLIGDYLKIASWIFAMPVIAFLDMKIFFWSELAWNGGFVGLSLFGMKMTGRLDVMGVVFMTLYVFYFIFFLRYSHRRHAFIFPRRSLTGFCVGFLVVLGASVQTWTARVFDIRVALVWVGLAIALSLLIIPREDRKKIIHLLKSRATSGQASGAI